ncbi:MAG: amidohydrolase [Synergistaceae bacterium]|jgi:predicted amidohydrolase YtcJ|nr:amidohydrolase [Synergistaceae bacterium]
MNKSADLIVLAGAMFRGVSRDEMPVPGGAAIQGTRILAVGSEEELRPYRGPRTQIYAYGQDSLLVPGFCDSHLHLAWTIESENGPRLRRVSSEDECVAAVRKWLDANKNVPWVVGTGWHQSNWPDKKPPDKRKLSAAVPEVPVCLLDVDAHAVWCNQKALDAFGISAGSPNPEGGVIYRFPDGEPTGYIEETPCMEVYKMGADAIDADAGVRVRYLKEACAALNKRGVTSVMDAMDTPPAWLETLETLDGDGGLNVRVACTVCLNGKQDYLSRAKALESRFPNREGTITFWGFKALLDGVGGTHTAWMTDDYADAPGCRGYPLIDPKLIKSRVLDAEERGYGVHLHACGTRAVEFGLDLVEEASSRGFTRGQRNAITHCDTTNDRDFARFGELGVVASLQPEMLTPTREYAENFYPVRFGEALMRNAWANRRFFDSTRVVSFSSDSPVTAANPMLNVFRATQRVHDDGAPSGGIHPEQRVTLSECLWACTYGGAYQLAREDILGTLEAGKLADLAVMDRNLFAVGPEEYAAAAARLTIMNGKVVLYGGV